MIQKIGLSIVKNSSNKLNKVLNNSHIDRFTVKAKSTSVSQKTVSKLDRFFIELGKETRAFFRKLFNKEELPKSKKQSIAKETNAEMQKRLELERQKRVVVEMRARDAQKEIERAGHNVKPGDIDQYGYLTTSGKDKINKPAFKGALDDLDFDNKLEKQLTKNHDIDSHSIDIDDKYTDLISGNHHNNLENETSHSLLDVLQGNHNHNHHENLDDIVENGLKYIDDNIDDLTTSLFD